MGFFYLKYVIVCLCAYEAKTAIHMNLFIICFIYLKIHKIFKFRNKIKKISNNFLSFLNIMETVKSDEMVVPTF